MILFNDSVFPYFLVVLTAILLILFVWALHDAITSLAPEEEDSEDL